MLMLTARFLTTQREDLFELTHRLMAGLEDDMLRTPHAPLVAAVEGTGSSGKKIFTDAAREVLFDSEPAFTGRAEYDEYWTGTRGGKPLSLTFMNAAWPGGYNTPALRHGFFYDSKITTFLAARQTGNTGGIDVVQNALSWQKQAGLVLHIERHDRHDTHTRFVHHTALAIELETLAEEHGYARYIEVNVRDRRLLASQKFRDAIAPFSPIEEKETFWARLGRSFRDQPRQPVRVYGADIPRRAL